MSEGSKVSMTYYPFYDSIEGSITSLSFLLLKCVNRYKDNRLSQKLFDLAERYNTRPGTHNYADDVGE